MNNETIILTKTERQLLLFEIFIRFRGWELDTILKVLPVERRMLQRDVKDLIDAGLISVEFSKAEQAYIKSKKPVEFHLDEKKPNRTKYLLKLYRLGTLMRKLRNDPIRIDFGERYDPNKFTSCKDVYKQLFPDVSVRTMQRDFEIFNRLGYPIKYNHKLKYYEFYEIEEVRTEFGVYRDENGNLCRDYSMDYDTQPVPWDEIKHPEYYDGTYDFDDDDW